MQPHQQRVVQEKADLEEKIAKLTAFVGTNAYQALDWSEADRLRLQLEYMKLYSQVLGQRIAAFD